MIRELTGFFPLQVIKHWFRNTLFKERQRNKDSPYNFNNPPQTSLNLEEYEKTGETKVLEIKNEVITTPTAPEEPVKPEEGRAMAEKINAYAYLEVI